MGPWRPITSLSIAVSLFIGSLGTHSLHVPRPHLVRYTTSLFSNHAEQPEKPRTVAVPTFATLVFEDDKQPV